jgi:hypothetical protein
MGAQGLGKRVAHAYALLKVGFRRQERQRQQGWVVLRIANILSLFERIVFLNYYFKIIDCRKP